MPWDGSENHGFTTGTPWLLHHSRAGEINVEADLASEHSVYRFYQQLLRLRRENEAFLDGVLEVISRPEDSFFVYTRSLGDEKWAVVCNFEEGQEIELPFECEAPALANCGRQTADGLYAPFECAAAAVIDNKTAAAE